MLKILFPIIAVLISSVSNSAIRYVKSYDPINKITEYSEIIHSDNQVHNAVCKHGHPLRLTHTSLVNNLNDEVKEKANSDEVLIIIDAGWHNNWNTKKTDPDDHFTIWLKDFGSDNGKICHVYNTNGNNYLAVCGNNIIEHNKKRVGEKFQSKGGLSRRKN